MSIFTLAKYVRTSNSQRVCHGLVEPNHTVRHEKATVLWQYTNPPPPPPPPQRPYNRSSTFVWSGVYLDPSEQCPERTGVCLLSNTKPSSCVSFLFLRASQTNKLSSYLVSLSRPLQAVRVGGLRSRWSPMRSHGAGHSCILIVSARSWPKRSVSSVSRTAGKMKAGAVVRTSGILVYIWRSVWYISHNKTNN